MGISRGYLLLDYQKNQQADRQQVAKEFAKGISKKTVD